MADAWHPDGDWLDAVRWSDDGLVAAIAQDAVTLKLLTLAWMNRDALARTVTTGEAHYWSRSRQRLWHKGEESGHVQRVREVRLDCDGDAIVLLVEPLGGIACHTGRQSCFFHRLEAGSEGGQPHWVAAEPVLEDPAEVYGHGG
jgi:phosphoribosyl-AMP cyclohydrolase